ncbi:MAG: hypothetical protein L0H73_04715 [Nitrococcus sp.]|nr:hypothetical protein [Nitrococcus sp.]
MIHRHLRTAGVDTPAKVHSALEHGSYHDMQVLLRRLRADPWGREATAAEQAAATSAVYGWPRVLSLVLRLAREEATLGEPVQVVGGTAAALDAGHRLTLDADYAHPDLRERYEELLDSLEARDDWETARTNYGVLILGNFQCVETGLRQLRRDEPLEVETVDTR